MESPQPSHASLLKDSMLTDSQLNIWLGQSIDLDNPLYNMAMVFRLNGKIDVERFSQAWQRIVDDSDALRTSIIVAQGIPKRQILPRGSCACKVRDFTGEDSPEMEFEKWAEGQVRLALPLDGELVESVLVKLGDQSYGWYLNQHHLVTDGFSTLRLFERVLSAYRAESPLNVENPQSYYTVWRELSSANADRLKASQAYWASRWTKPVALYGEQHESNSTRCDRVRFKLDRDRSSLVKRIAGESGFHSFFEDLSLFAVFATILFAFLKRVTGESRVGFDSPVQNRSSAASKDCLGCFMELFPLSVEVGGDDTFRSLGEKVLSELQLFFANATPGSGVREFGSAHNVVLNFVPRSFARYEDLNVTSDWLHSGHIDAIHDFRMQIHDFDAEGEFVFQLEFKREGFPEEKKRDAVAHFRNILEAFIDDRDICVDSVDILASGERQDLIEDYNQSSDAPVPNESIWQRISAQALRTPESTALRQDDRKISYRSMLDIVNGGAQVIRQMLPAGSNPVAIYMTRSPEAVLAILSVLASGNYYVPIDSRSPTERVRQIVADSDALLVVTENGLDSANEGLEKVKSIRYGELNSDLAPTEEPLPSPGMSDLAYLIYTSGSSGSPKGVEIEHRGLMDYIDWAAKSYAGDNVYNYPLFTSLSFDLTVTSLFLPLVTGGALIVYPESDGPVDSALAEVVDGNEVHFIKMTPSHLSLLRRKNLSNSIIETIVLGGENLSSRLAMDIHETLEGRASIFNEYGPTEAVVGCMIHKFDPETDPDSGPSVPIGKPADHVKLYALNEKGCPVPRGTPGELGIVRYGLARGYRNQPETTSKSFIANPLDRQERLYRSGDLVRFRDSGILEFLGRIDSQLKISGHRIEPGEIESILNALPDVDESRVIAFRRGPVDQEETLDSRLGGAAPKQLVAYYVSERTIPDIELTSHLYRYLPQTLVPAFFIHLDAFPLTRNGKIDIDDLPDPPEPGGTSGEAGECAPQGPVEERVAEIWRRHLGIESIGINQSFFQLGGSSLSALETALAICQEFDIDLPLQSVLQQPTIRAISETIENLILSGIEELSEEEAQDILQAETNRDQAPDR